MSRMPPSSSSAVRLLASVSALAAAGAAFAGPIWDGDNQEDAKQTPQDAQAITTGGSVLSIKGSLNGTALMNPDLIDLYRFEITNPLILKFSTAGGEFGGNSNFDSQIFVFQAVQNQSGAWLARAIFANNDISDSNPGSFVGNAANDGSGFVLQQPGTYFVAITLRGVNAFDPNGGALWQGLNEPGLIPFGELQDFGFWGGDAVAQGGSYDMRVAGIAGTVPAPGAIALLGLAGLARRRRR
jgi:MYXO-CTERM domain-containing protein